MDCDNEALLMAKLLQFVVSKIKKEDVELRPSMRIENSNEPVGISFMIFVGSSLVPAFVRLRPFTLNEVAVFKRLRSRSEDFIDPVRAKLFMLIFELIGALAEEAAFKSVFMVFGFKTLTEILFNVKTPSSLADIMESRELLSTASSLIVPSEISKSVAVFSVLPLISNEFRVSENCSVAELFTCLTIRKF